MAKCTQCNKRIPLFGEKYKTPTGQPLCEGCFAGLFLAGQLERALKTAQADSSNASSLRECWQLMAAVMQQGVASILGRSAPTDAQLLAQRDDILRECERMIGILRNP